MTQIEKHEKVLRVGLSALQWGETPGNLRFSLFVGDSKLAVGSLSLGGTYAYRLQERIIVDGPVAARVACCPLGKKFALLQLMSEDGWAHWEMALNAEKKPAAPTVLVDDVSLPMGRRTVISNPGEVAKM